MDKKIGTLYGIGVGPGDPELVTVKASKILACVDIVFAAASTKNNYSLAVNIAKAYIPEKTTIKMLFFPMTIDKNETQKAWEEHSKTIIAELEKGRDAAFLTLGDSMTYSTYGYILRNIQNMAPSIKIETIPGITSYQAAAACLNMPLVEGEESLLLLSGANGGEKLRSFSNKPENIVFLKAYRNIKDINSTIDGAKVFEKSVGIINCGQQNQEIINNIEELNHKKPDYWTLIIAKQKIK
ncbi:MAG: precorrin-2 C(20)-methyltransferase [Desulfobacterales bacterium]|nr:precorrin-2 C(20)-methyltransferase [Desulfobacterales bacterium]